MSSIASNHCEQATGKRNSSVGDSSVHEDVSAYVLFTQFTPTIVAWVRRLAASVIRCVYVTCVFVHMIKPKRLKVQSQTCHMDSPSRYLVHQWILGQRSRSRLFWNLFLHIMYLTAYEKRYRFDVLVNFCSCSITNGVCTTQGVILRENSRKVTSSIHYFTWIFT